MTRTYDERGSLPIALLAVLMVGALVTVVISTAITGQHQTRFDQRFEQALGIAEAGLDRAIALVEGEAREAAVLPSGARGFTDSGSAGGGTWVVTATRSGTDDWTMSSIGTAANGTTRRVETHIDVSSLFSLAAFGKFFADFNGGNGADSYRSGTFNTTVSPKTWSTASGNSQTCNGMTPVSEARDAERMCHPTGQGSIATNGELFLKGNVIDTTDYAEIHYANEDTPVGSSALPGATGYCKGANNTCTTPSRVGCDARGTGVPKLQYCAEPIVLSDVRIPREPIAFDGSVPLAAGVHVFTNATLTSNTIINGTPASPTIIYLTGTLTIPNFQHVNFSGVTPNATPGLLIYSTASGPALNLGNHASFAGAIYAPNAAFAGGAQGNFYGSLVAGSIDNNGGWNFHYDEALKDVTHGAAREATGWVER